MYMYSIYTCAHVIKNSNFTSFFHGSPTYQQVITGHLIVCLSHTWVGLQKNLSLSVDFFSPVLGAVCTAHQVLKMSIRLCLLCLTQLFLCELRWRKNTKY